MPGMDFTENKLILLYTIREKKEVSRIELSDFIIFKAYMDYFTLQDLLAELTEAELISCENEICSITEAGEQVLEAFYTRIPNSIRTDISEYARTSAYRRSSMLGIESEIKENGGRYDILCLVKDYDRVIFSLHLEASSEESAYAIRNNWLKRGTMIYRSLINDLKDPE